MKTIYGWEATGRLSDSRTAFNVNTGPDAFPHTFETYASLLSNLMAEVYRWLSVAKKEAGNSVARQNNFDQSIISEMTDLSK